MGLSSLAVVMGIIGQVYSIDLKVNQLYQQKLQFSRMAQYIGTMRSRALGLKEKDPSSRALFRPMDFRGETPELYSGVVINAGGKAVGAHFNPDTGRFDIDDGFEPGIKESRSPRGSVIMPDGWVAPKSDKVDPDFTTKAASGGAGTPYEAYSAVDPSTHAENGAMWCTKEEIEAMCDNYFRELNNREKEIDFQLEELKARRQALQSQKDEFIKYVGEGIKSTFKNNYA